MKSEELKVVVVSMEGDASVLLCYPEQGKPSQNGEQSCPGSLRYTSWVAGIGEPKCVKACGVSRTRQLKGSGKSNLIYLFFNFQTLDLSIGVEHYPISY